MPRGRGVEFWGQSYWAMRGNFDLIVVEYGVNDDDIGTSARYQSAEAITVLTEQLVRKLLYEVQTPVIYFEGFRACAALGNFHSGEDAHQIILRYYGIPRFQSGTRSGTFSGPLRK